jgi:diphthamide biosynthesis enzyme Dph1/Dph2-like protein
MVKVLYIESKLKNQDFILAEQEIKKLPKNIFLAYSLQYRSVAEKIKKQLLASNIKITKFQQVLGCSKIKTDIPVLLIGAGRFHATNLFLQAPKVYLLEASTIIEIPYKDIELLKIRLKTSLIKFLNASNIGILVSTKPGQENLDKAIDLRQKLKKKGKSAYIFMSSNIDPTQFENFNIDSWVNTACSGLSMDNPEIINYDELKIQKLI